MDILERYLSKEVEQEERKNKSNKRSATGRTRKAPLVKQQVEQEKKQVEQEECHQSSKKSATDRIKKAK
jgi:hypothetical protein